MDSPSAPLPRYIWVDDDSFPAAARTILYRYADRHRVRIVFVSNRHPPQFTSPHVRFVHVAKDPDAADDEIMRGLLAKDLLIASDAALIARAITRGAWTLVTPGTRTHWAQRSVSALDQWRLNSPSS